MTEREIKLPFASAAHARAALESAGASPHAARRLQDDVLYDNGENLLWGQRSALRLRKDGDRAVLTFKGPVEPGLLKSREEIESGVESHEAIALMLARLGFRPWFRYQKYREELRAPGVIAAIDETPAGVFVEIEGDEAAVIALAARLGRGPSDFMLDSYRGVWLKTKGAEAGDMVF
ncbi:MAG: class IV adenylate cyclase [Acidobacteriota bacterium]|nr:class IV adenylate cyclase [Acidobacteriota bacterium]MDQ3168954.1 class IV adenylate cyclase [Acidobacteriota bacterium]